MKLFMRIYFCSICIFSTNLIANGKTSEDLCVFEKHKLIEVSIVELIASPEKYACKSVRTHGVFSTEFEDNGVYLNFESFEHKIQTNKLGYSFYEEQLNELDFDKLEELHGKYILIEGVFYWGKERKSVPWRYRIKEIERVGNWKIGR